MFDLEKDKDIKNLKAIVVPAKELYFPILKWTAKVYIFLITPFLISVVTDLCRGKYRDFFGFDFTFFAAFLLFPLAVLSIFIYHYHFVKLSFGPNIKDSEKYFGYISLGFKIGVISLFAIYCIIYMCILFFNLKAMFIMGPWLIFGTAVTCFIIAGIVSMELSRRGIEITTNTVVNFLNK